MGIACIWVVWYIGGREGGRGVGEWVGESRKILESTPSFSVVLCSVWPTSFVTGKGEKERPKDDEVCMSLSSPVLIDDLMKVSFDMDRSV